MASARRAAGLGDVLAVEVFKVARQPSTRILLGILVGYFAFLVLALASVLKSPAGQGLDPAILLTPLREDAVGFTTEAASSTALILLVVFSAQLVGNEFARGTLRTLLTSRATRMDVATGKLLLVTLASMVVALVLIVGSVVAVAIFSAVTGESLLHVDALSLVVLWTRTSAGLAAWAIVAFGTTLATRSLGVGIGSTLGGLLGGDVLRGLLAPLGTAGLWASRALPNAAIATISSARVPIEPAAWAWIVPNLLVYVVLLNAYAVVRLCRMDIIAATK